MKPSVRDTPHGGSAFPVKGSRRFARWVLGEVDAWILARIRERDEAKAVDTDREASPPEVADTKDAKRYRFLRDSKNAYPLFFIAQRDPTGIVVQFKGALVDANIDEMMKRFPPQGER